MIKHTKIILIVILSTFVLPITAQDKKVEIEKTIEQSEMPEEAVELLKPLLEDVRKVKLYYETDGKMESYEAKFIWKSKPLSIEFYKDGKLMDIEHLIKFKEIDKKPLRNIKDYFNDNFTRHKILRIQRQYSTEQDEGEKDIIEDLMTADREDIIIRYEIVAEVQNNEVLGAYEFLFDHKGDLIEKREAERRSSDNFLY